MEFYKPYSFLYKQTGPYKLTASFIVYLRAEERLSIASVSTRDNTTTLRYTIETDTSQTKDYKKEVDHDLDWDGNDHKVTIIIGSGSGSTGGAASTSSGDYD